MKGAVCCGVFGQVKRQKQKCESVKVRNTSREKIIMKRLAEGNKNTASYRSGKGKHSMPTQAEGGGTNDRGVIINGSFQGGLLRGRLTSDESSSSYSSSASSSVTLAASPLIAGDSASTQVIRLAQANVKPLFFLPFSEHGHTCDRGQRSFSGVVYVNL